MWLKLCFHLWYVSKTTIQSFLAMGYIRLVFIRIKPRFWKWFIWSFHGFSSNFELFQSILSFAFWSLRVLFQSLLMLIYFCLPYYAFPIFSVYSVLSINIHSVTFNEFKTIADLVAKVLWIRAEQVFPYYIYYILNHAQTLYYRMSLNNTMFQ